jgi:hypothetical protein
MILVPVKGYIGISELSSSISPINEYNITYHYITGSSSSPFLTSRRDYVEKRYKEVRASIVIISHKTSKEGDVYDWFVNLDLDQQSEVFEALEHGCILETIESAFKTLIPLPKRNFTYLFENTFLGNSMVLIVSQFGLFSMRYSSFLMVTIPKKVVI